MLARLKLNMRCSCLAIMVFITTGTSAAEPAGDATRRFEEHMVQFAATAEAEPPIATIRQGSDDFAAEVNRSQNMVENARFADAADILEALLRRDMASDWREMLETRVRIVRKWAKEPMTIEDFRKFFVETGPWWFNQCSRPIVMLWRDEHHPKSGKQLLLAELLGRVNDQNGQILALLAVPEIPDVGEQAAADALLGAGNALYRTGQHAEAETQWTRAVAYRGATTAEPKALFNLGVLEKEQGHYQKAIDHFTGVLNASPNDREPGAHIMEAYRNYSHRCALEISYCHTAMGAHKEAFRYAWLAKNRYPYLSWCGTCASSEARALNMKIARLGLRAYGLEMAACLLLFGFGLWYLRRRRVRRRVGVIVTPSQEARGTDLDPTPRTSEGD